MGQRAILCLDMDAFFVSVERALDPGLRGKPAVVGGRLGGRGVVTSASYEARAYGVHSAMPLAQARRLCPHAIFVPGNLERYHEASQQVRAILEEVSPFLEMASIDEAFLDLSGTERSLGPPLEVARRVQDRIRRELDLPCSIGVAENKVVAKVACEQSKPNGLLRVPPGREAAFLAPLPVRALPGVGPHTAGRLAELRISSCGDLAAAPLLLLQRLLGKQAASLQRRARGIDNAPVASSQRPAKSIGRSTTFAQDSRDRAFLRATLYDLVERVGRDLRRQGVGASCVTVQVRWADFRTHSHQRTVPHPTCSDAVLYRTADELLTELLERRQQRVRLLGVRASQLSVQGLQLPLFLPERAQEVQALDLSRCLDRIRERYGSRSIQRGTVFLLRGRFRETEEGGERVSQSP
jgi:DNA polymerase-4